VRVIRARLRLLPVAVLAAGVITGAAWAAATDLETATQRSLLAVVTTMALSTALHDTAGALTAASPTSRRRRLLVAATVAVVPAFLGWLVVVQVCAPAPGVTASLTLEWATVAMLQLAAGAHAARWSDDLSAGPGLVVGLLWFMAGAAPRVHDRLHPVGDHLTTWVALLTVLAGWAWTAGTDPAARRRLRLQNR